MLFTSPVSGLNVVAERCEPVFINRGPEVIPLTSFGTACVEDAFHMLIGQML